MHLHIQIVNIDCHTVTSHGNVVCSTFANHVNINCISSGRGVAFLDEQLFLKLNDSLKRLRRAALSTRRCALQARSQPECSITVGIRCSHHSPSLITGAALDMCRRLRPCIGRHRTER